MRTSNGGYSTAASRLSGKLAIRADLPTEHVIHTPVGRLNFLFADHPPGIFLYIRAKLYSSPWRKRLRFPSITRGALTSPFRERRNCAGGSPNSLLNTRLNAASDA